MKRILLVGVLLLTMYGSAFASDAIPVPTSTPQSTYVKEVDKWLQYFMSKIFDNTNDALKVVSSDTLTIADTTLANVYNSTLDALKVTVAAFPQENWQQTTLVFADDDTLTGGELDSTSTFEGATLDLRSIFIAYTDSVSVDTLYVQLRGHNTSATSSTPSLIAEYKLVSQMRIGGSLKKYNAWTIDIRDIAWMPYYSLLIKNPNGYWMKDISIAAGGRP